MLARRLPTILPPLDEAEALETSIVYSAAGKLAGGSRVLERPFRSPHHESTLAAILGGGAIPKPGEISLAHNGVLFLDELPEFKRPVLEAMREPLEDGVVTLVRARTCVRFPASFSLVAAMNPCPCGYSGSSLRACTCDLGRVRHYRARVCRARCSIASTCRSGCRRSSTRSSPTSARRRTLVDWCRRA